MPLGVVALVVGMFSNVPIAGAAAADIGYRDFSYAGASAFTPTKYTTQHKLWFNDGIWWGVLFNHTTANFDIYRLTNGSQTWNDTGVVVDDRDTSHIDVLWTGTKLYVAGVTSAGTTFPHVNRLSYDTGTNTYSVDSGFPKDIPQTTPRGAPGISIVADSNDVLWAAYMQTTGTSALLTSNSVKPSCTARTCSDTPSIMRSLRGFLPRPTTRLSMSRTTCVISSP